MERENLRGNNWLSKVWWFYVDGFRAMTVGRTLWAIIALKVFVFFVIIKWIFFPDFLSGKAKDDAGKADYVRHALVPDSAISSTATSFDPIIIPSSDKPH